MKRNLPMILIVAAVSLILILSLVFGAANFTSSRPTFTPEPTFSLPTSTPAPTNTPDVCSTANLPQQVERLQILSREFDDTFELAKTLRLEQTITLTQDMQRIRRNVESLTVPPCLLKLQEYLILYMDSGINIFATAYQYAFSNPNMNQSTLDSLMLPLLVQMQNSAKLYVDEQAKLMGWTPIPFPTLEGSQTLTPTT